MVSLILKRISYRFEGVDTWFWKQKRKKEKEKRKKEKGGGGGGEGIAMNPTGMKVVCFSRFLLRLSLPLMFAASFYCTRNLLSQFSVIRSRNCTPYFFFVFLTL